MALTIGSNIASLTAQRKLAEGTSRLSQTFERLSSGQRINKAADDAAGLSISESLRADRKIFLQGVRNFNDGISLLNIADGAIENLSTIVVRLKELSEQSINGTYTTTQRSAIDREAQALSKEYTRIVHSTKFNGVHLLDGSLGSGLRLQGGYGTDGSIFSGIGGAIGDGSLEAAVLYEMQTGATSSFTYFTELDDINGDGILDMISAGARTGEPGHTAVRLGTGGGSFGEVITYAMESTASRAVLMEDINGDGILDMISAGIGAGGRATIRLGNGNGSFGTALSYLMEGTNSYSLALGDVNGDGILDIATAGSGAGTGRATVRLGNGDGTFGSALSYQMEGTISYNITLKDLNGDGILDMTSAGQGGGVGYTTVRIGNGDGTFGAATSYQSASVTSQSVTFGDLNQDGVLDMVSGGSEDIAVWLGVGDGTFGSMVSYSMGNTSTESTALGDMNGDGILDMVSVGSTGADKVPMIRLGNGDGTFGAAVSYPMPMNALLMHVALDDPNADGVLDVVISSRGGHASILAGGTQDGTSPLLPFDLNSSSGARRALVFFEQKIQQLARQRGQIGAFQARINVGVNNLQSASENYTIAESRIRDADIAEESSHLVRLNILQQAAASVLAQANLQPDIALRLLNSN